MSLEQEFAAKLARVYEGEGWELQRSEDARAVLDCSPDLFLRKGQNYLVVEVKRAGSNSGRAIEQLKEAVEVHEGWRFELKLIPSSFERAILKPDSKSLRHRLAVVEKLLTEEAGDEAFVVLWILIESALRSLVAEDVSNPPTPTYALLREAYEDGVITDIELMQLQSGCQVRNRLVHGYGVRDSEELLEELLPLAKALVARNSANSTV